MSQWQLGIDFGTSYTVAAVARDGQVTVVDIEANGNSRLPSCVYLSESGEILVGTAAMHQAPFGPERFEPTPKRAIGEGEIFLGDRLVEITELISAVLQKVYTQTCRQQGESTPSVVRLTHPADWTPGSERLKVLSAAAEQAGIAKVVLIPEPVAAAARIATATPPGKNIAVYDFGGGTFDAAVLFRTPTTFIVAGPPAGRDPLGGEDIDQRIITYLGTVVGETNEEWLAIINPADVASRRHAAALRSEVQHAKETLSEATSCQLWIPGLERDIQLTRDELQQLIAADIEATVDCLETALTDAKVQAKELAGLYLVGGSSRIPLVADTIWRRLGVRPGVQGNPKSVVAMGAAGWVDVPAAAPQVPSAVQNRATAVGPTSTIGTTGVTAPRTPTPPPPEEPAVSVAPPERDAQGRLLFKAYLSADVSRTTWAAGSNPFSYLTLERPGQAPLILRAKDEPAAVRDSEELAARSRVGRVASTPGFRERSFGPATVLGMAGGIERRFYMTGAGGVELAMVERYLVAGGRALVVAFPEAVLEMADRMTLGPAPGAETYVSRFEVATEPEWVATEQLVVRRNGNTLSVLAEHKRLLGLTTTEAWLNQRVAELQRRVAGAVVAARTKARVFSGLDGEIATVRWFNRGSPMLTKLGVSVTGVEAFTITISLPHRDQNQFASLARQVGLNPAVLGVPV